MDWTMVHNKIHLKQGARINLKKETLFLSSQGNHMKTFKHLKNTAMTSFPYQDILFLKREFMLENAKQLYGIIDLQQPFYEENKVWFSIIHAFRSLSANGHISNISDPSYQHDLDVYLTYESIKLHYSRFMGTSCNPSFALRLYNILSRGFLMKRIYLPQFLAVVYPVIYGNWIEKSYFAFRLYDGDGDGIISSIDLSDIIKNILEKCPLRGFGKWQTKQCDCILYKEVSKLYNMSLEQNLLIENEKFKKDIDFIVFLQGAGIGMSCMLIEMQ